MQPANTQKNFQVPRSVNTNAFGMKGAQMHILHDGNAFDVKMDTDGKAIIYDQKGRLVTSFKPNFKPLTAMSEPKKPNLFFSALKDVFTSGSFFSNILFSPFRLLFAPITVPLKMYAYSKAYKEYTAKYAEITKQNRSNVESNKLELFNAAKIALSNMKKTTVDAKSGPNVELKPSNSSCTPNAPIGKGDVYIDVENVENVFDSYQKDNINAIVDYEIAYNDLQEHLGKITPTINDNSSEEEKTKAKAIQEIKGIIQRDRLFYVSNDLITNAKDSQLGEKINKVIKTLGEKTEAYRRVGALDGAIVENSFNLAKIRESRIHKNILHNINQQYSALNNLNFLRLQNHASNIASQCHCNHTVKYGKVREINGGQSHYKT